MTNGNTFLFLCHLPPCLFGWSSFTGFHLRFLGLHYVDVCLLLEAKFHNEHLTVFRLLIHTLRAAEVVKQVVPVAGVLATSRQLLP